VTHRILFLLEHDSQLVAEWAIQLTPGSSPEEFASNHGLFYAGKIPNGDLPIHIFKLTPGPLQRPSIDSNKRDLSTAQRAFIESLEKISAKSQEQFFTSSDQLIGKRQSSDTDPIVWFEQQVALQRDKRLVLPTDPLFPTQWHLIPGVNTHVSVNAYAAWERNFTGQGTPTGTTFT